MWNVHGDDHSELVFEAKTTEPTPLLVWRKRLSQPVAYFSRSVMVSVGVSVLGVTGLHFVNPGIKINEKYYRETLLKEELLPDMRDISE